MFSLFVLTVSLAGAGLLTLPQAVPAALAADQPIMQKTEPTTPASNEGSTPWFRLVPECATAKGEPGNPPPVPSLVCVLQTFGNISQIILGLTGSLALLMFVYGGFLLVTSGGSQEKVGQGKKAITNAIIGILIIMTSGLLIQYGMDKLELRGSYKAIGVHCTGDSVNPNGDGQFIQKPDGSLVCVKLGQCATLSKFKCLDVTQNPPAGGKGLYCIPNLCGANCTAEAIKSCLKDNGGDEDKCRSQNCERNSMCCYDPNSTAAAAPTP